MKTLALSLKNYSARKRRGIVFKEILTLLSADFLLIAGGFALDNLAGLGIAARSILTGGFFLLQSGVLLHLAIRTGRMKETDRELATGLEKELGIRDNCLVNAVCFKTDPKITPELRNIFLDAADRTLEEKKLSSLRHDQKIRKGLKIAGISFLPLLLYAGIFHEHAGNALIRFISPGTPVNAMNFVRFEVSPGNASVPPGKPVEIRVRAFRHGKRLSNVRILVRKKGVSVIPYPLENGKCVLIPDTDLVYSASAAGEKSPEYQLRVVKPPSLKDFRAEVKMPESTGRPDFSVNLTENPVLRVPEGAILKITCATKGLVLRGLPGGDSPDAAPPVQAEFRETRNLSALLNTGKHVFDPVWNGRIEVRKDHAPKVNFLNAKTNLEAGYGEMVPIHAVFADDYGVVSLKLTAESEQKETVLRSYTYPTPGITAGRETFLLRIAPELLPEGGMLEIKASVSDGKGQMSISERTITIHQADLTKRLREMAKLDPEGKCYAKLMELLTFQIRARENLALKLRNFPRHESYRVLNEQKKADSMADEAAKSAREVKLPPGFIKALELLRMKGTLPLLAMAGKLVKDPSNLHANEIVLAQTKLIERIRKILGVFALYEKQRAEKKILEKELEAEKENVESMEKLKEKLDTFRKEQKKIQVETEKLDPKKAEDWTEKEEKLLGDLAAKEEDWSKFFKAKFSDLSKKHDQDFSNSSMADEFVELYEELQKAGEALKSKKIEMATLAEDTAADSANAVAANIERWLSDKKDSIKWNSEEDGKAQDTDLTDLPAELTDIIGDLIESEEDMTDDTNDSTNSYTCDSDEALGWGTGDGTIDSMQAKGITGNVLPNNNEVGGRSGEGRSGRSSGQFAEKEATGKGGRKTPTRLQQSPFEKGTVDDKSKDAQGGVTGGGKQSGVGGEGLSGVTADRDPNTGKRLGASEAELKQKTNAMLKKLEDRNLPTGDIREALSKLHKAEQLGSGGGVESSRMKREAALSLRRARAAIDSAIRSDREIRRKKKQDTLVPVKYPHREKVPASCEEFVGEYFKALAVEETE